MRLTALTQNRQTLMKDPPTFLIFGECNGRDPNGNYFMQGHPEPPMNSFIIIQLTPLPHQHLAYLHGSRELQEQMVAVLAKPK